MRSLRDVFPDLPEVKLVDVGASPIDGAPPYSAIYESGRADLVGFEPDEAQFARLQALQLPRATFLRLALGDGHEHQLRVCRAPGMTSLLEPDSEVLEHFHGFGEWGKVEERVPLRTRRLDDVPEARGCDYLKLDVQGGELDVLRHGAEVLADCLVVHTEVQFVPFYLDQPLFAELDQLLRAAGFWLHRFEPMQKRAFKPLLIDDDPYAGLEQVLWSDAVFIRRFTDFSRLEAPKLWKLALFAHDLYGSYDLAALALSRLDERDGGDRKQRYVGALQAVL